MPRPLLPATVLRESLGAPASGAVAEVMHFDTACHGRVETVRLVGPRPFAVNQPPQLGNPMQQGAMRTLNQLGNVFFAKAISLVVEEDLSDVLCGTKLLARHDYERFVRWRDDFGDFDPFGDFELLFPAAVLGLGIIDLPVRYRVREYGSTQIRRFRDGLALLRMTAIGLLRIRLGRG